MEAEQEISRTTSEELGNEWVEVCTPSTVDEPLESTHAPEGKLVSTDTGSQVSSEEKGEATLMSSSVITPEEQESKMSTTFKHPLAFTLLQSSPSWQCIDPTGPVYVKKLLEVPSDDTPNPQGQVLARAYGGLVGRYFDPNINNFDDSEAMQDTSSQTISQLSEDSINFYDADKVGKAARGTVFLASYRENVDFIIGHALVARALEMAVVSMRVGEVIVIRCGHSYGYSDTRRPSNVPSNAPLEFLFQLRRVEKEKNLPQMSLEEKLAFVDERKKYGKELVANKLHLSAIRQYDLGLHVLDDSEIEVKLGSKNRDELKVGLTLNKAICMNNIGEHSKALQLCNTIVDDMKQSHHTKARFQRAMANKNLKNWEDVIKDMEIVKTNTEAEIRLSSQRGNQAVGLETNVNNDSKVNHLHKQSESDRSTQERDTSKVTDSADVPLLSRSASTHDAREHLIKVADATIAIAQRHVNTETARLRKRKLIDLDRLQETGGLYADKPLKGETAKPFNAGAPSFWSGAWNIASLVGGLAWAALKKGMQECCTKKPAYKGQ